MTQDEIIEMANKAYAIDDGKPLHPSALFHLEAFAKLVAQHEREECAKVCEDLQSPPDWNSVAVLWKECKNKLANAIRARGQA